MNVKVSSLLNDETNIEHYIFEHFKTQFIWNSFGILCFVVVVIVIGISV